ncbi:hypothetical protein SAMN05444920_10954 [Nonomuraea solani]|uniref:Neutral zinc metallopeptidase n=1 Tax=Nonomuraea solani TaxID=1144553 RepID=A0A1H6EC29_9ACTN|nr:hypothetical protein SAMN05444920_10954 [Nonomuraea solani]
MNHAPKNRPVALTAVALAFALVAASPGPALANQAHARPVQTVAGVQAPTKALATANRLYKTGRLTDVNCSPGSLPAGSTNAYRRYLTRVTSCLNEAWGAQFRKAKMPFAKPRLRIITRKVNTACGRWSTGAEGYYCSADRTMYMLIGKKQLRRPFPPGITRLVAHEYGHHVQQVSKIWTYYWAAGSRAGKAQRLRLSRNSELQAECFSANFMSTMRGGSVFTEAEWLSMVKWFREFGAEVWPQNDHGKGPTQAAWMTRGFTSGAPGSCNTWAASPRSTT